ncbi:hypothetical protein FSP39_006605 [Pinctada imbricata]|uniref:Sulfatase N-terminal domain-containing protein n=1 Tax=Pinctada imbricata TaxID=66713 RepID=A0AA88YB15_PINIB|nr:hypothetical protein FSP39_006605 [Pinctada imbricata]
MGRRYGQTFLILWMLYCSICDGKKAPHILFIVADDLGWNDVGYQNPAMITPNIDKMARKGVIMNSSYVHPICTPSRNSFLTGVYPFRVGLQNYGIDPMQPRHMSLNTPTLPEKLKNLGYSTHMLGKWHLGYCNERYTPNSRGFDTFMGFYNGGQDYYTHMRKRGFDFRNNSQIYRPPPRQYSTKTYAKRAIEIIKHHKPKSNPLFMYLAFQSVHTPLQVPKRYEKMYKKVKNKERRIYSGMVSAMDDAIGAIMTAFRKYKYMNNLLVVFTTDNGGAAHIGANNLPLRGSKTTLWEGGTRAVTFVYSKTLLKKRAYVQNGLMHAIDWYPTLLAAAGGRPKHERHIDGVNQWPLIRAGRRSRRKDFVYDIDKELGRGAIRVGDYKLIYGKPGDYNDWYSVPKGDGYCPIYDARDGDEIFLYDSLNHLARRVQHMVGWFATYIPGYKLWRRLQRQKHNRLCKMHKKRDKETRFPMYLLYNIKDDPGERRNIAGYKPMMVYKMKARMDRYMRFAMDRQSKTKIKKADPKYYNNTWSPGWC